MTGGLDDLEQSAFAVPLNAGGQADGGATGYALISIAISLKRIADELTYSGNGGRSTDLDAPMTVKDLIDVIAEAYA